MKILIFSAYYEPEKAASIYLATNLCEGFAEHGWDTTLYTPVPTRGIGDDIRSHYKKHKREHKVGERLEIIRVSLFGEGRNPAQRAIRYIVMNLSFIAKALRRDADIIFVQSTPPTQGAMAALIKRIKKIPFVYNLQDVFPDSMVNAGMTRKGSLLWIMGEKLERFTYRNADKIIVISKNMKRLLLDKGVPDEKIEVVYNWVESEKVVPIKRKDNYLFDKYGLDKDKFYVVYAGNLGQAQNIDVILEAAKLLEGNSEIEFLIFGEGVLQEKYRMKAQQERLRNISFHDLLPYDQVSYVYSLGDAGIVSCKEGFGGSALPSKTWSIMAAASVVVASFDEHTDMQDIIENNKIGIFCRAGDAAQLAEAIIRLHENTDMRTSMGWRARRYVKEQMSREHGVSEYIRVIESASKG